MLGDVGSVLERSRKNRRFSKFVRLSFLIAASGISSWCLVRVLLPVDAPGVVVVLGPASLALAAMALGCVFGFRSRSQRRESPASTGAWIDEKLGLSEALMSAVDAEQNPTQGLSAVVVERGREIVQGLLTARRLPGPAISRFLPELHVVLLVCFLLLTRMDDLDRLSSYGFEVSASAGSGAEPPAENGGTGSGEEETPEGVGSLAPEEPSPGESTPLPEFKPDPKFVRPLQRPGPEVIKDALTLEDVRAPLGTGGQRPHTPEESASEPPDFSILFERMKEMDAGRANLLPRDQELVSRYFESLKGLSPKKDG